MISEALSRETCAACRFCCAFRRRSLWELPVFSDEAVAKLSRPNGYGATAEFEGNRPRLEGAYATSDPEEEAPCPFLDPAKGCRLEGEDKPFDCRIWPLRVVDRDGTLAVALDPACKAIGARPPEKLVALVRNGLGKRILEYAAAHPEIVKPWRDGWVVLESGTSRQGPVASA